MPTPGNSLNITAAGLVKFDGTATFTGVTTTNHDVLVGATSNGITNVGPGTAGQVLQSGGAAADPAYSTATYPSTAGASGNVLTSDGTNWISQAPSGGSTTPPLITKFTASGTWTKSTSPATTFIEIIAWGGGGGGGSGMKGATSTNRIPGEGGWGGQVVYYRFPASVFSASETVTVGNTAAGGTAQTVNSTDGNNGTTGNDTSIGSVVIAKGGSFGNKGTLGAVTPQTSYRIVSNVSQYFVVQGGQTLLFTGQGGTSQNVPPLDGFVSIVPTGGGYGGIISSSNSIVAAQAGGTNYASNQVTPVIAGGTAGATSSAGGNGNNFSTNYFVYAATGGGGGGASTTVNAGNGGNGGTPGGGGGGGGAGTNSVGNSGAGGTGARGELWVIEYF